MGRVLLGYLQSASQTLTGMKQPQRPACPMQQRMLFLAPAARRPPALGRNGTCPVQPPRSVNPKGSSGWQSASPVAWLGLAAPITASLKPASLHPSTGSVPTHWLSLGGGSPQESPRHVGLVCLLGLLIISYRFVKTTSCFWGQRLISILRMKRSVNVC